MFTRPNLTALPSRWSFSLSWTLKYQSIKSHLAIAVVDPANYFHPNVSKNRLHSPSIAPNSNFLLRASVDLLHTGDCVNFKLLPILTSPENLPQNPPSTCDIQTTPEHTHFLRSLPSDCRGSTLQPTGWGESFHAAHDTSRRDDSSRANEIRSVPADRFYKNSFLPCSSRGGYDGSQSRQVVDKNAKLDYLQRKKKPNNTRSGLNLRLETEISRVFPFAADDDGD